MTRVEIKERAKAQLGKSIFSANWMYALLVCLLVNIVLSVLNVIPGIGSLAVFVLTGVVTFGQSYCFLKQTRDDKQMDLKDFLVGFNDFASVTVLGIMQTLFIALWSLLFVIPGIVKAYAYSMAYYIKADHPEYTWKQCLDASQGLMMGHKAELFVQDLSFIGWLFVGALCFGVGTLWVLPYIEAARAQFYQSLVNYQASQFTADTQNI